MKKLLLFDIDGTLVDTGGTGFAALQKSLLDGFGIEDDLAHISLAGATDTNLCREILAHHQIEPTAANIAHYLDGYLHHLQKLLPEKTGRLLPGILELLTEIKKRPELVVALLTGNLVRGAEIKLAHFGIWHFFEFGAFADDHHIRNELGPFARARALEKHGVEFPPEGIYVVGDTPKDIACGRAIGAKTVAVATGEYSTAELAEFQPDFLFESFAETAAAIERLGW
ncbi:MAG TPA: HAD family hydrolase [Chthoniobacterales bacterium]